MSVLLALLLKSCIQDMGKISNGGEGHIYIDFASFASLGNTSSRQRWEGVFLSAPVSGSFLHRMLVEVGVMSNSPEQENNW